MIKNIYIALLAICLVACGSYRSLDLNRLTTGMTKAEVEKLAGLPDRILAVNETSNGYQEVLEYRTSRGDIYALEFWNDYLTGYEYLYEDVQYVPSVYPTVFPPYGRPLYVYPGGVYRPNYNRPNYNNRPNNNLPGNNNNRPGNVNRPDNNNNNSNNTNRPSSSRPTTTR
ncbi:MAG: hypothetical protein LUE98_03045 [Tannerellaceae bacterium]|nr:hypothetical protein [Tannerellaceae bacterium]